ncbi:hypothetical protein [Saccharopolyspora spinosa]|nr:hypothetical protein [Saccharopolyspora spinosa]
MLWCWSLMMLRNVRLLLGRGLMRLRNRILLRCDLLLIRELMRRLQLRLHHAA